MIDGRAKGESGKVNFISFSLRKSTESGTQGGVGEWKISCAHNALFIYICCRTSPVLSSPGGRQISSSAGVHLDEGSSSPRTECGMRKPCMNHQLFGCITLKARAPTGIHCRLQGIAKTLTAALHLNNRQRCHILFGQRCSRVSMARARSRWYKSQALAHQHAQVALQYGRSKYAGRRAINSIASHK